jgi:hypothetical protein
MIVTRKLRCSSATTSFVVQSFSKYFNMTGWRLGWLVVPERFTRDIEKLAQNLFISPSTPAQHAALAAFTPATIAILERGARSSSAGATSWRRRSKASVSTAGQAGRRFLPLRRLQRPDQQQRSLRARPARVGRSRGHPRPRLRHARAGKALALCLHDQESNDWPKRSTESAAFSAEHRSRVDRHPYLLATLTCPWRCNVASRGRFPIDPRRRQSKQGPGRSCDQERCRCARPPLRSGIARTSRLSRSTRPRYCASSNGKSSQPSSSMPSENRCNARPCQHERRHARRAAGRRQTGSVRRRAERENVPKRASH